MAFTCAICERRHEGVSLDTAFALPDEVWAILEDERPARAKWTNDLCELDGRYFIRALLPVPLLGRKEYYGWGVWVEVAQPAFERYVELYEADGSAEPPVEGLLANEIPTYPRSLGFPVRLQFGPKAQRPTVGFTPDAEYQLAEEQRSGIDETRLHEILVARGALEGP